MKKVQQCSQILVVALHVRLIMYVSAYQIVQIPQSRYGHTSPPPPPPPIFFFFFEGVGLWRPRIQLNYKSLIEPISVWKKK